MTDEFDPTKLVEDDLTMPPFSNPTTSREAALSMYHDTKSIRAMVLSMIDVRRGATSDELEAATGMRHQTISARIWELNHRYKLIEDSGAKRATRSGRLAIVWTVKA